MIYEKENWRKVSAREILPGDIVFDYGGVSLVLGVSASFSVELVPNKHGNVVAIDLVNIYLLGSRTRLSFRMRCAEASTELNVLKT